MPVRIMSELMLPSVAYGSSVGQSPTMRTVTGALELGLAVGELLEPLDVDEQAEMTTTAVAKNIGHRGLYFMNSPLTALPVPTVRDGEMRPLRHPPRFA